MSNTAFLPQVMQAHLEVRRAESRLRTALDMLAGSQESRLGVIETIEAALQKTSVLEGHLYEAVKQVEHQERRGDPRGGGSR